MADGERLGASFSIDTTNLRAGLQQADRLIRQSEANFREAAAGIDNWTKSEEGLTKRQKALTEQIDLQKNKIAALTAEKQKIIDKMQAEGKSQEEIDKAIDGVNKQITKESKALDKLESDLNSTNKALEDMSQESGDAGDAVEETGKAAEKSTEGFTVMKGAISNLIANGLSKLASAAKNAISSLLELPDSTREYSEGLNQLETAFGRVGYSAEETYEAFNYFGSVLGDTKKAQETMLMLAQLTEGEKDLTEWTDILTGVYATFGKAIATEGLTEAILHTAQLGEVQGTLADALEWAGITVEDFNKKLAKEKDVASRTALIQETLNGIYLDTAKTYNVLNKDLLDASTASTDFENAQASLGDEMRPITTAITKLKTEFLKGLTPAVKGATPAVKDFLSKLEKSGTIEKFSKALTNLAKSILPPISKAVKFVAENFETLTKVVAAAVTVFSAFKAAMAVTTAITAAKTAIAGLEAGVGLATKAQTLWNAAMSSNPIGAVITAVALLTAGVVLLSSKLAETAESTDYLTESQREAVTAAQEAADAYKDTKKAADEMAAADLANIDHTKTLYKELQNLTDENGKVKEGYEARAQYILNELNDALGTEYSMNGNVIKSYKEIASSIDTVIEKKKAQILLQAYEESYKQAINNVAEAEKARATQAQELAKVQEDLEAKTASLEAAQKAYEESLSKGDSRYEMSAQNRLRTAQAAYDGTKETLDNLQAAYNETETSLYGYYSDINSYETASTLVLEGETGKAISYLNNLGSGFKTAASTAKLSAQDQRATLQQQVIDTEVNAQLMKEAYQNGVEGVSEEMVKTAEEQASAAKEEFLKVGGDITKGIAQGAEGEENTKWTLSSAMQRLVNSALRAAKKAAGIKSPSRLFKKAVGRFIGLGVAAGVDDSTKDTVASVKNQIKAIKRAYDVSDINDTIKGISSNMSIDSGNGTTGQPVIVNQTNNYSQAHSRYELYRSKQETAAAVRLALAGG